MFRLVPMTPNYVLIYFAVPLVMFHLSVDFGVLCSARAQWRVLREPP